MAQTSVSFRIDEDLKKGMEKVCKDMGISISTAFILFAAKVKKDRRIPFDITADADPFYSVENMNRLRNSFSDVKNGKSKLTEHALVEVDNETSMV